jgi:PleD family two-component response regulator
LLKEELSVIVVDDLQFSQAVVKSGLKNSGFSDIRTASSGEEALFLLNQRRAHVVIADFWMPGLNGLEVTDLIRRWDENNDRYTGIVLLTAEDATSGIVVAFERGVDDFVSKSADQYELSARVFGAARTAYQQNELRERTRSLGNRIIQEKQYSQQDRATMLPNRAQLESNIRSLVSNSVGRGGGLAVGLIEVKSGSSELRPGTLKTISNSLQLALRPMDRVFRFDVNTFAVTIQYQEADEFNLDMFQRLVDNIKRHTRQTSDQGKQLDMAVGVWHGHGLDPVPSVGEIIASVLKDLQQS